MIGVNNTSRTANVTIAKNRILLTTLNGLQTLNNTVKHVNVAFKTIIVLISSSVKGTPNLLINSIH